MTMIARAVGVLTRARMQRMEQDTLENSVV